MTTITNLIKKYISFNEKKHTCLTILPKEVVFAVESSFSGKTFLGQIAFALAALHALDVPSSVQHVKQKAVQDRPLAAGAVDHGFDWANNTVDEARTINTPDGINGAGRALTEDFRVSLTLAFSLASPPPLPACPDSPGAPGSMCSEKPVDQVSPRISPCMRKADQRPE